MKENIQMMNKKFLQAIFPGMMLATLLLTSCGTGDTQTLTITETAQESVQTGTEGAQETDAAAENTEGSAQGDTGVQTSGDKEEVAALAERNDLEREQRLDYTSERQAQLAEITVNLAQDTEEVRQKAQGLLEAMAAENVDAAVDNIMAEDWYTVMLSDLLIGQRNYTGAVGNDDNGKADNADSDKSNAAGTGLDGNKWKMTILSDELGQHCTAIEYPIADGRMFYVQTTDSEIRYYVCAADHTGAFASAVLNLTDGSFASYEGTLSAANRPEGTLTIQMGTADLSNGAAEAFHNRSAQVTAYEGEFSADGKPATSTPANLTKEGKTAYASAKSGKTTYYLTVASEGLKDVFTPKQLGISNIWE